MQNLRTYFTAALVGAIGFSAVAAAQTPAPGTLTPPTIAVVDVNRVLAESSAGRSIQSQLEVESRKFRDQVTKLQDELKTAENELLRQRSVMSPEAVNEKGQELQRKRVEDEHIVQERQEALGKGQKDAIDVVGDNMKDIIQQLAVERHIGMVLSRNAVLSMADKNMDITDDVVQRLNTKLPTVTVTVAAPGAVAPAPAAPKAAATPAPAKAPAKK
jgi:Skp family chaperone for outer membrane proteins